MKKYILILLLFPALVFGQSYTGLFKVVGTDLYITNTNYNFFIGGSLTASSIIKSGGAITDALLGDGSVTTISVFGKTLVDDADSDAARTTLGVDVAGTDNSTNVTLNATATNGGLSLSGQDISFRAATNALTGYATAAQITKLEGIETAADVTDATNVTAAGALMDSEVDADLKTFVLPASTTISTFGASLVDDANATAAQTTIGLPTWAGTSNITTLGTIGTGLWNGTIIGDTYITKTGTWTGAFNGTTVTASGAIITNDLTDATSGITGSIQTDGGVGIAKALYVGTSVTAGSLVKSGASITDVLLGDGTTTTASAFGKTLIDDTDAATARTTLGMTEVIILACSNETSTLVAGTSKLTFRIPYNMTLTGVRASVTTAPTGLLTVDINESGVTILSTKLTIDSGEKTSTTAAAAVVISDSALGDDNEITIDLDSTTGGIGLKITLIGTI